MPRPKPDKMVCVKYNMDIINVRKAELCDKICIEPKKVGRVNCNFLQVKGGRKMKVKDCEICKVVTEVTKSIIVFSSDTFIAYKKSEKNSKHLIMAPKEHMSQIGLLSDDLLMSFLGKTLLKVTHNLNIDNFRMTMSVGDKLPRKQEHAYVQLEILK